MNHLIAKILSESLRPMYDTKLVTTLGGLVSVASVKTKDNKDIRFPVPFGSNEQPVQISNNALVPDSRQRAIIYFEGNDSVTQSSSGEKSRITSNLRLVCWYQAERYQVSSGKSVHSVLVSQVLGYLASAGKDSADVVITSITPGRIFDSTARIFNQYTYQQERGQYMQHPYYAFAIDLVVNFQINHKCNGDLLPIDTAGCC